MPYRSHLYLDKVPRYGIAMLSKVMRANVISLSWMTMDRTDLPALYG